MRPAPGTGISSRSGQRRDPKACHRRGRASLSAQGLRPGRPPHRTRVGGGSSVVRGLHWPVAAAPSWSRCDYRVFDVDPAGAPEDQTAARLGALLGRLTSDHAAGESRPLLLSVGADLALVLDELERLNVRSTTDVIAYVPADLAPMPPGLVRVLSRADVIVPYTAFGGRALRAAFGAGGPWLAVPIPLGVDVSTFAPLPNEARRAIRRHTVWRRRRRGARWVLRP